MVFFFLLNLNGISKIKEELDNFDAGVALPTIIPCLNALPFIAVPV